MRIAILLLLLLKSVLTLTLNLDYLDPVKLQTVTSQETQQKVASEIISKYTRNVVVEVDSSAFRDHKDVFTIRTVQGTLHICASSGVAALWGFNYYLKKYSKSQIAWQVQRVDIPDSFPDIYAEIVFAHERFRYYQNVCTASYSFVWWQTNDWIEHIQWMAFNGINLALAPVAQEAIWARVYRNFGMTEDEIDQHFTGPAFLAWLRMGNLRGWGGPLLKSWNDKQKEIQDTVIDYMYNLGIIPVFPAFNGHVPKAFARLFPNVTFHAVDTWNKFDTEYCCGLFVDPNEPLFKQIGEAFLKEIGGWSLSSHIYSVDPFNEVKINNWSTAFVTQTSKSVFSTLSEFDDKAVWLLQNWMFVSDPILWPKSRVQSLMTSVPNGRILVLDLQAEQWPQYELYDMYFGQPFIWCLLHNFGGTLGMFGNMKAINNDVYYARTHKNSTMIGTGLTPEGINQNYVVYDLMLETTRRLKPIENLENWAGEYAERRYGCNTTTDAWRYLLKSVYSFDGLNRVRGKYVITRRPSFRLRPWAWYKSHDIFKALQKLLYGASDCNSPGFYYDVVDVTRQALQYRAEQLYVNIQSARYSNAMVFNASIIQFLDAMKDIESILQTNEFFRAENWISQAESFSKTPAEEYFYELNARNQITLWGPNGEISDYACKQWAEVFRYYYIPRWSAFLNAALDAKIKGEIFDEKAVQNMIRSTVEYNFLFVTFEPTPPSENPIDLAMRLYWKWAFYPGLKDLPLNIIRPEPGKRTTLPDVVNNESEETDNLPSVLMWHSTTPIHQ